MPPCMTGDWVLGKQACVPCQMRECGRRSFSPCTTVKGAAAWPHHYRSCVCTHALPSALQHELGGQICKGLAEHCAAPPSV